MEFYLQLGGSQRLSLISYLEETNANPIVVFVPFARSGLDGCYNLVLASRLLKIHLERPLEEFL